VLNYRTILVDESTGISMSRGPRLVSLLDINCAEVSEAEGGGTSIACDEVVFEFLDSQSKIVAEESLPPISFASVFHCVDRDRNSRLALPSYY
jgi:hypothetical protein